MGGITSLLKAGATSSLNRIKNYDVAGKATKQLDTLNIDLPDLGIAEATKDWKLDIDPSVVKLPAGVSSYISPLAKQFAAGTGLKLPSEINGVKLPEMPDLSSVTSKVDEFISGMGIDTEKLGIRSVSDILAEPDLSALKSVEFSQPVDLNNMPDLTTVMDGFELGGLQSDIDSLTSGVKGMGNFDISQYF